jgi:hypothetical protein
MSSGWLKGNFRPFILELLKRTGPVVHDISFAIIPMIHPPVVTVVVVVVDFITLTSPLSCYSRGGGGGGFHLP